MGPIRIRAWASRAEHRLGVLLVVLGLALGVVLHHGVPAHGGGHGDDHGVAATTCLGAIPGAVVIVGLVAAAVVRRRRRPRPARTVRAVVAAIVPTAPLPRARAGPLFLRLAVIRR